MIIPPPKAVVRATRPVLAVLTVCSLTACAGSSLGPNAFVGDWDCEGETVAITTSAIVTGAQTEQIAWIETGKNADFGLFTTKGARYSVFDQERNSLTLVAHADNSSRACRRTG